MNTCLVSSFTVAVKKFEGRFSVRLGVAATAFHHGLVFVGRHVKVHVLPGVHRSAAVEHLVVQVRACAFTGGTDCAYLVAAANRSTHGHTYLGQVCVTGAVAEAMVYYDFVTIAGELEVCLHNYTVTRGIYRSAGGAGEVLAVVETGSAVHRVGSTAEGTGQMEAALFRHDGRHAGNVGYHVTGGEGHPLHLVEQHALQIRTLYQIVRAADRGTQEGIGPFSLQGLVATSTSKSCGTGVRRLGRETVD